MYQYSKKEIMLFKYFGCDYLTKSESVDAHFIYRNMCINAFMNEEIECPETESLRRCMRAFDKSFEPGGFGRLTDEWDDLIEFSDDTK